jgi:hypothetical protein
VPLYGVPGTPTLALGRGDFTTYSPIAERVKSAGVGQSFTISDFNPVKTYSKSTFDALLTSPNVSSIVNEGQATNAGVFLGPWIFSNIKFTFPIPDDLLNGKWGNLSEQSAGLLVMGTAVGFAVKIKPLGFKNINDVIKYDPRDIGIVLGLSSPYFIGSPNN